MAGILPQPCRGGDCASTAGPYGDPSLPIVDVHHGHEEWLPGWADELARVDPSFLDGRRPTVEGGSISRCGLDIGRLERPNGRFVNGITGV
jgi:hypothetical protein